MAYDQNGNFIGNGGCSTDRQQLPAVAFVHAQPERCAEPSLGALRTASVATKLVGPQSACNLDLGTFTGNTNPSVVYFGSDQCLVTDEEVIEAFELAPDTIIFRSLANCRFAWQLTAGRLEVEISGTDDASEAQFSQRLSVRLDEIGKENCPTTLRGDATCSQCDDGVFDFQSYGSRSACRKVYLGLDASAVLPLSPGATVSITDCLCEYSLPGMVSCVPVVDCPAPAPAPTVSNFNGNGQVMNTNGQVVNQQNALPFNR